VTTKTAKAKSSGKKSQQAAVEPQTFKLGVRLLSAVDDRIRELTRRTGDFSNMVAQAILEVDLENLPLVVIRDPKVTLNTVRVNRQVYDKLTKAAEKRETSMNVIINTAMAHWLEGKHKKLRFLED
jgi:hypothetical protein